MKKWFISLFILAAALAALYMTIGRKAGNEGAAAVNNYQGLVNDAQKSVNDLNNTTKQTEDALKGVAGRK